MSENINNDNPFVIKCKKCGAPAKFDILKQNHYCLYCRTETSAKEGLEERNEWISSQNIKTSSSIKLAGEIFYTCKSCGATVIMKDEEVISSCEFCRGTLARRSYVESDDLPEAILPFYISREEAIDQVIKWCDNNKKRPETKLIRENIDKITGYYLPFELVKGPVNVDTVRANCFKHYQGKSYLDGIAINTSEQMNNILLDACEPFNLDELVEFNLSYLNDYKIKVQDINEDELKYRVSEEVKQDLSESLNKTFQTDKMETQVEPKNLLIMSAALPYYIINVPEVKLAINDQTGRIAVQKNKIKKNMDFL